MASQQSRIRFISRWRRMAARHMSVSLKKQKEETQFYCFVERQFMLREKKNSAYVSHMRHQHTRKQSLSRGAVFQQTAYE